jgi:hypothetical protein
VTGIFASAMMIPLVPIVIYCADNIAFKKGFAARLDTQYRQEDNCLLDRIVFPQRSPAE